MPRDPLLCTRNDIESCVFAPVSKPMPAARSRRHSLSPRDNDKGRIVDSRARYVPLTGRLVRA